ncbi:MAG: phosphate acyltransferase PlsX [Vampirovibrionales bacterium]
MLSSEPVSSSVSHESSVSTVLSTNPTTLPPYREVSGVVLALDVMGGDLAPRAGIEGAFKALSLYPQLHLLMVATASAWQDVLAHSKYPLYQARLTWIEATEVIGMDEHPVETFKRKKNASMRLAAQLVKQKKASGFVSAGNTGAVLASALFDTGRLPSVKKPALSVMMPYHQKQTLLLDAGANAECKLEHLIQFAHIGTVFMRHVKGIQNPTVGLLNIGTEAMKGNALAQEAYKVFETLEGITFKGNVEGKDIFSGKVDVVVTDGFSGNISLKSAEGMGKLIETLLKHEARKGLLRQLGAVLLKPALRAMMKRVRPDEFGGALMLGIDGVCIKAHGNSNPHAIFNAIRVALEASEQEITEKIREVLSEESQERAVPPSAPSVS